MLTVSVLTLFPQIIQAFTDESIIKKAKEKGLVRFQLFDLRNFSHDSRKTVDDHPLGGGTGMLLKIEPLVEAITYIEKKIGKAKKILLTPAGEVWDQEKARKIIKSSNHDFDHLLLLCGHYEGFDARIDYFIDQKISLGKFVLGSGESAAIVIIDTLVRLIPGVLKKETATTEESFMTISKKELLEITKDPAINLLAHDQITLLEHPQYALPRDFQGLTVPEVLLSGNHQKIREWRIKKAWEETKKSF